MKIKKNSVTTAKVNQAVHAYLKTQGVGLPIWIRAPKNGTEFYTGFSRAKLYELAGAKKIRSVSIREPGQIKGTRLFSLASVLAFIDKCEADNNSIPIESLPEIYPAKVLSAE